jgi:molybdate transport system substrate-binding protein
MRIRVSVVFMMVLAALAIACGGGDDDSQSSVISTVTPQGAAAAATPSPVPSVTDEVTVFAAASLTDAFNEIGAEFTRANPRATVKFNFAASTALRTQLEQGAKADVYASADQVQMDNARKAGVIDGGDRLFVKNKLVVIYPTGNPGKITTVKDLANPGLKLVLTDKNVPIGAYARTALEKMSADAQFGTDFGRKVLANLKSEEANVRAVVTKVQLGEADAGIVYASDVTPAISKDVTAILIPDQFNTTATYPIAMVKDAPNKAAAQAFIQYVRSAPGQAILKKWNFIVDADTGIARAPRADSSLGLLKGEALARPRDGRAS